MNKETFLNFYLKTPFYDNAKTAWESVEKAFLSIPCSCCGAMPLKVNPLVMAGAMGSIRVECGKNFKPIREYASGEAYEGRADLGNTQKGDGVRFAGKGYLQITGRANYAFYGQKIGLDLISNPDLALDVEVGAKLLAHYFTERKVVQACMNKDWLLVRKLINGVNKKTGKPNGYDDFMVVMNQYIR